MILSTVRSQPVEEIRNHDLVQPDRRWLRDHLGFLTDSHEINVGITRAKYGLIIIGMRACNMIPTVYPLVKFDIVIDQSDVHA